MRWFSFNEMDDAEVMNPALVEKEAPTPEFAEKQLKQNPNSWIRAHAASLSFYFPEYIIARLWDDNPLLATIKARFSKTKPDWCFDGCGKVSYEDHFKYKYQLVLEGNTAPWQRIEWLMLGGFVVLLQDSPQH